MQGGWLIEGEKTWISNGGIADVHVLFARTGEAPGARGLSAFLMPADAPGLEIAERLEVSERTVKRYMAQAYEHCLLVDL